VSIRQALFIAPCSHTFHYKCIKPLLDAHHPAFSCPLCRSFADLEEDVEVDGEVEFEGEVEGGSGTDDGDAHAHAHVPPITADPPSPTHSNADQSPPTPHALPPLPLHLLTPDAGFETSVEHDAHGHARPGSARTNVEGGSGGGEALEAVLRALGSVGYVDEGAEGSWGRPGSSGGGGSGEGGEGEEVGEGGEGVGSKRKR
jgi:E3 ubiquitin-protein ligase DMA1/2